MIKLCLGTAQFGQKYGITNHDQIVSQDSIKQILDLCREYNITSFDTAYSYGSSEKILGTLLRKDQEINIISKFPDTKKRSFCKDDVQTWEDSFQASLTRLRVDSLYSLLLHQPQNLRAQNGNLLLDWIISLKERKLINKIGLSIYSRECLNKIDLKIIDIIQLPLSLYDQRAIHSGLIDSLIEKNISIYARSIYLQGLLLTSLDDWPLWISKESRNHHQAFIDLAKKKGKAN